MISKIEFLRKIGVTVTKSILVEGSIDNSNWTEIGTASWPDGVGDELAIIEVENPQNAQYLRVSVTESNDAPWSAVAEMDVYKSF